MDSNKPATNSPEPANITGKVITTVLLLILLGVVVELVRNREYFTRRARGVVLEKVISTNLLAFGIKDQANANIIVPVRLLTGRYADGEISEEQLNGAMESLLQSPAFAAIALEIFENKYIPTIIAENEQQPYIDKVNRYRQGVFEGKISIDEALAILADCTEQAPIVKHKNRIKKKLNHEELLHFVELMESTANAAGIAKSVAKPDSAVYLQKYIDIGLANPTSKKVDIKKK